MKYGADKVYLANAMKEWYRAKLMHLLDTLVPKWEEKMGLKCGGFTIREMKTRWGSCNQRSHKLLFNLELAKKPKPCIEYVVVHELAHIVSKITMLSLELSLTSTCLCGRSTGMN